MRVIVFYSHEVRTAIAEFLLRRNAKVVQLGKVHLHVNEGVVHATAFARDGQLAAVLDTQDLLASVLIFCRQVPIPISRHATKRLGLSNGDLVLTMAMNANGGRTEPRVEGSAVIHGGVSVV